MAINDCATHSNVVDILGNNYPINSPNEYITREQAINYGANSEPLSKYKGDKELVMLSDIANNNGLLFSYDIFTNTLTSNASGYEIEYYRNSIAQNANGIYFPPDGSLEISASRYEIFYDSQAFSIVTGIAFTEGDSKGTVLTLEGDFNDDGHYDKLLVIKNRTLIDFTLFNSASKAVKSIYMIDIPAYGALIPFGVGFENSALYLRCGGKTYEYWLASPSGVVFMLTFGYMGEYPAPNFMLLENIVGYEKQIV